MARPGVTYQDIALAANELKGQGKSVTIENIRAVLGTGSIGTINKYLRQWKELQSSTGKLAAKENLPEELISLVKGLWEGVLTQSLQQFEPLEASYQQEITELKAELEKYKQNNQRWQKLFNQWQQEKMQLANEKLTVEQALEFAHKENYSLHSKQDNLLQQLQEKQERIDELHKLHKQAQENLEHYREAQREQRLLDQQQFEQQKQQLSVENKLLKDEIIARHEKFIKLQQTNISLSESYQQLEEKQIETLKEKEKLQDELRIAEQQEQKCLIASQNYKDQNDSLLKSIDNQSKQLIDSQAEQKILMKEVANIKSELITVQDQMKLLNQEKWEIAQEKAILEGQLKQLQAMMA